MDKHEIYMYNIKIDCYYKKEQTIRRQGMKNSKKKDYSSVLHTVQINFHAVDVNKDKYIQTPIGLLIF